MPLWSPAKSRDSSRLYVGTISIDVRVSLHARSPTLGGINNSKWNPRVVVFFVNVRIFLFAFPISFPFLFLFRTSSPIKQRLGWYLSQANVQDIEQLVKSGQRHHACPYFTSRKCLGGAQVCLLLSCSEQCFVNVIMAPLSSRSVSVTFRWACFNYFFFPSKSCGSIRLWLLLTTSCFTRWVSVTSLFVFFLSFFLLLFFGVKGGRERERRRRRIREHERGRDDTNQYTLFHYFLCLFCHIDE